MSNHSPNELHGVFGAQNLRVVAVPEARTTTLVLTGELDLASAPTLLEAVDTAARAPDALTIDLSRLSFIDCSGVYALLKARDACAGQETSMWLVPGPRAVQRVFALTGSTSSLSWATSEHHGLLGRLSRTLAAV